MKARKFMAALLVGVLLLSAFPFAAFASDWAETNAVGAEGLFGNSDLDIATEKNSTLAPGITQDAYTLYNNKEEQVKMWVTTADMSVDSVKLFASYKDMDPTNYGMSKLTEQVASFNEKAAAGDEYYQGTVVAGINASYYNMITGKPTGTFVMNGIDVTTESEGNNYGYFAVMKDGSVKIGNKGDYSKDKGNIQEAIGIYTMLIVDGKICDGLNAVQYYPRQTIGITADGEVILMTADGNQAPKSVGLTVLEQAQVMKDLGCVWAGHLDGGGSCTYAAKAEGSNEFKIENSPSDGSERSVSNGFLMVSTAVADGVFASASLTAENEYVTPGSTVAISATGVDKAGFAAEIPSDIAWQMKDDSYGSVTNGVFTSSGKVGSAVVQMVYDGEVVGEAVINVVLPDKITFASPEIVVPYGKSVPLNLTATYGAKDVAIKPSDFTFNFTNASIGSIDGFTFNAGEEGVATESSLTAAFKFNEALVATTTIKLGKGSEVVYDFEDGTTQNIVVNEPEGTKYNYVWPEAETFISTTVKHSGNYALGATINYGNSLESGYMKSSIYATETKVFENAVGIGVWIYIPDEFVGLWARWTLQPATIGENGEPAFSGSINSNTMDTTAGGTGVVSTFYEPGWHYLYADVSAYDAVGWKAGNAMIQLYISDRDGSAYGYVASEQSNIPGKFTIYIDDITVDYSSAVDDREAPIFSNITYATAGMPDAATLNGQTITTNQVTIAAAVKEYTEKSNFTGLDESTIKAYIDGVEVKASYSNGIVSVDATLTNGKHVIKFSACDKMGNYACVYRYITVNAESSASTVKLVPTDASLDRIKLGSIYNMDIVATAIEEVSKVQIVIDLDNNSTWELDHMTVAAGFEATYSIDLYENIATITITRTGKNTETGEKALATLPVRVWTLKTGYVYPNGTKAGSTAYTLAQFKSMNEFWRMSVIANVDMGVLTRVDGTSDTFTGDRVFCDTEMWANYANMTKTEAGKAYYNAWDGGHVHAAHAIADKAATCTENGYTGRTFCDVCNSVVDWGTTIPATGHSYETTDGVLKCACGDLFSGVYTDGKTYVDGVVVANGWNGESYYVDGVKLTGVQIIEGKYYNFGDDGVCAGKRAMSDEWWTNEKGEHFYMVDGVPATGYRFMYPNPVYFYDNGVAFDGEIVISGETCIFEKAVFVKSTTADVLLAGLIGPKAYFILYADGTLIISGEGETYEFVGIGNTYLPNISWKNRPWGKNTDFSNAIKKIVIGKDITEIGDYFAYQCYNVAEVVFEEGSKLENINRAAFNYLLELKTVELPESVKHIDNLAFAYNAKLVNVKMPQSISYIQYNAFSNSGKVVLNVVDGSYAEQYADKYNIAYVER